MATVAPNTTTGKAKFEGTSAFRSHDDAADSKDAGGSYSHVTTELSATEFEELHDWARYVNSVLRAGVGAVEVYNDQSAASTAVAVYISGYDATSGRYLFDPADVENAAKPPQAYLLASVGSAANGTAYLGGLLTAQNTAAAAAGDPVYATGAAGAWSLTAPAGANVWQIGVVKTVDASAGVIFLFPAIRVEVLAESVTVEYSPSNYTPVPSGSDTLEAHLAGIDAALAP